MRANEDTLKGLCKKLLSWDPEIVEIIQFGSSVYAPKRARDVDVFVFTRGKRSYGGYLDRIDELDLPFDVDIVVKEVGKGLREGFVRQILGAYRILYGDGKYLQEVAERLDDPTFEESWSRIRGAKRHMRIAKEETNELDKDREIRDSFNDLFHAARIASMVYLSTKETRWGRVRKALPTRYKQKFREFIDTLHIKYFYEGIYPKDRVEEEFEKWLKRIESYVGRLEVEFKAGTKTPKGLK